MRSCPASAVGAGAPRIEIEKIDATTVVEATAQRRCPLAGEVRIHGHEIVVASADVCLADRVDSAIGRDGGRDVQGRTLRTALNCGRLSVWARRPGQLSG